ncbi:MAG TPA: TetR/AcrR family transcriptional regulator [Thermoleophilaceae bacterium]
MSTQKRKYELKARAESQRRTRERIAAAASQLHEEVGVGKTTVADIARRAGVQRLTVYNHFADLSELLPACSAHWLSERPPPDPEPVFGLADPGQRVKRALADFYRWYRENEAMQLHVHGERASVPELEEWMAGTADILLAELADALSAGFGLRGKRARSLRAHLRLALDFWTWRRLASEGLDEEGAAELMTESALAIARS